MLGFKQQGHRVISLSQAEGRQIHPFLQSNGIETFTHVVGTGSWVIKFLNHLFHFILFCYKNKVDFVYSHLESANFVSVVGQFFIRAQVFVCRHHIDEAALRGFDKSVSYRLTYKLAEKIIVVSNKALKYSIHVEKIDADKIYKINLGYDFNLFEKPMPAEISKIKNEASNSLLLLTVGRLTKYKRADLALLVLKKLAVKNIDARLIILGTGEDELRLRNLITVLGLENMVSLKGHVSNVMDYVYAADFILHPSIMESSCVVVKEAGLVEKPVIVCEGIGDFDDYIVNDKNGFCVPQESDLFVEVAYDIILTNFKNKEKLNRIGSELRARVIELFGIENTIKLHNELIKK